MVADASPPAPAPEHAPAGKDDVVVIPHEQVSAAFVKGMPLVEQPDANLKVEASRRDGPGKGEVHVRDADVIYVLGGTATLVTGGSLVDPAPIEPEEVRGSSVRDGTPHHLVKGDVLIVPKGVPHWFKEVGAPFTYYVVKVRS
jgi:glc operon protein GlcG